MLIWILLLDLPDQAHAYNSQPSSLIRNHEVKMSVWHVNPDPEELVPCPYQNSHMVRQKRFPYHLMKCRKQYTGNDFATCPFNARHEMPRPELRYHVINCPDKAVLEQEILYNQSKNEEGTYFKGNTAVPSYFPDWQPPASSEDWDSETPSVVRIGVDPKQINPNGLMFKDTSGMTPAQKKNFKRILAKRAERTANGLPTDDLDEDLMNVGSCEENVPPGLPPKEEPATKEQQLRLPKQAPQVLTMQQRQQKQQATQQPAAPPSVFAYSLGMAGIGRGMNRALMQQAPGGLQMNGAPGTTQNLSTPVALQNGTVPPAQQNGLRYPEVGAQPPGSYPTSEVGSQNGERKSRMAANIFPSGPAKSGTGAPPGIAPRNVTAAPIPQAQTQKPMMNGVQGTSTSDVNAASMLASLSRGRGIGRGAVMKQPGAPVFSMGRGMGANPTPSFVVPKTEVPAETSAQKTMKKLQKKLREIDNLLERERDGEKLNPEELEKVHKKTELEVQLQQLRID
ncbi:unnamed protein product [Owenia fusiformis]|uniref:CHHC U11-48K-type domain-containing protein n=1 Tax=Owenia fusiformis TaxID=6347 RepID=A0A8S4N1H9_OWEFU|nr:unnamed protein product [Owenia fusiformis]